jgi:hypothetical protein
MQDGPKATPRRVAVDDEGCVEVRQLQRRTGGESRLQCLKSFLRSRRPGESFALE